MQKPNKSKSSTLSPKAFSAMERALRVEYPGAFYNVINCGNVDGDMFQFSAVHGRFGYHRKLMFTLTSSIKPWATTFAADRKFISNAQ